MKRVHEMSDAELYELARQIPKEYILIPEEGVKVAGVCIRGSAHLLHLDQHHFVLGWQWLDNHVADDAEIALVSGHTIKLFYPEKETP